jgi:hypothetical protein
LALLDSSIPRVQVDLRTAEGVEHLFNSAVDGGRQLAAAEMDDPPAGKMPKDDPAQVAQRGYEALMRGEQSVVAASLM